MSAQPEVLVVDDNRDAREIIIFFLKGIGLHAIEASTGPEALLAAQATHPNLILLDLALPGISGDEVTARLKADQTTRDIPVIVLTALSKDDTRVKRAIECGAEEILMKPYTFKPLGEAIRRYVQQPHDVRF
jgi:two-component system phosphate regulon response regulator PhoB